MQSEMKISSNFKQLWDIQENSFDPDAETILSAVRDGAWGMWTRGCECGLCLELPQMDPCIFTPSLGVALSHLHVIRQETEVQSLA